jgi:WD40 repeat protein
MKPGLLLTVALAATQPAAVDLHGDPLPPGAVARLGTVRFRAPADIRGLAFSPDGKRLAARVPSGMQMWDAGTGKPLWFTGGLQYQSGTLTFTGDGKDVVASHKNGWLVALDAPTGNLVRRLDVGASSDSALVPGPTGTTFAGVDNMGAVVLADAAGDAARSLVPAGHGCRAAAWSPDGKLLAVGGHTKVVFVWDVAGGKQLRDFPLGKEVSRMAFGPGGKTLAVVAETQALLLDAATGKILTEFTPAVANVLALWLSKDGKQLAIVGANGETAVRVWDTGTGKVLHSWRQDRVARVAAFAPDGKTVALSYFENRVSLWETSTGKPTRAVEGHVQLVLHLAYLPDGQHVATVTSDHEARVWEAATGKLVRRMRHGETYLYATPRCFAGGKWLVSREADWQVGWWNLLSGEVRYFKPPLPERWQLRDVSEDGQTVVIRTDDEVLVWDVGAAKVRLRLKVGRPPGLAVLSPDGRWLAINDDTGTKLWSTMTAAPVWGLRKGLVAFHGFTPDGRHLLASDPFPEGKDPGKAALVWLDVETGAQTAAVAVNGMPGGIAAFSLDGRFMATAHWNGTVQLWDARSRLVLWEFSVPFPGNEDSGARQIGALAFAPHERRLAVAVSDTSVLIYDVDGLVPDVAERVKVLTPAKRAALWAALAGGNGEDAFRTAAILAATPEKTVAEARNRLAPVALVSEARLAQLLADLDAPKFAQRDAASKALADLGDIAEPALHHLLAGKPTLEVRQRAESILQILEKRYTQFPSPALFAERSLDVLERIGTADARTLLEKLARGDPRARQTRQARKALRRMAESGG